MKTITASILLLSLFSLINPALAQSRRGGASAERLVLEMSDTHFQGQNSIIHIKNQIQQRHPGLNLQNYELKAVHLVAKSKQGQGTAELIVGRSSQDRKSIAGNPRDFRSSMPRSFDRLDLYNYSGQQGVWQLHLRGNIIVRKLVLSLELIQRRGPGRGRPGRINYIDIGSQRFDKIVDDRKTFQIHQNNVHELSVIGDGTVEVKRAIVTFGNGRQERLFELEGNVYDGETKTAYIDGRNVVSLEILGTSPSLFGSRAKLKVEAGVRY